MFIDVSESLYRAPLACVYRQLLLGETKFVSTISD
jgi:hypothetical protein